MDKLHNWSLSQWQKKTQQFLRTTCAAINKIQCDEQFLEAAKALAGFGSPSYVLPVRRERWFNYLHHPNVHRPRIITTGMGKAGHIAEKVASSLCSLGMSAAYLHPGEALHGDVGLIVEGDVVLAFSTSGKTREVVQVARFAKRLKASKVIAVTSHPDGAIRRYADIVVDIGVIEEAGFLGIAPTTSVTVMLVVGDLLASMAAELRGTTMKEFSTRHHGGYLGHKSRKLIPRT